MIALLCISLAAETMINYITWLYEHVDAELVTLHTNPGIALHSLSHPSY
jgi:hypothetical protein